MGLSGRQMTDWLLDVLNALDTRRRPGGATVHLLLDLYERQSRKLDTYLAQQPPPRSDTLAAQARQELAMTREALHLLDKELPPSTQAHEHNWPQTRQRVLQALWPLAEDDNLMERSGYPQAQTLIAQMVQQSSRQLGALG